jgi:Rrf2 family protein
MLRLNRTTEYGLIALRHIRQKANSGSSLTSAREIADTYGLPFEITAKTLQRLKEFNLIESTQGARGGYTLGKTQTVTLAQFIDWMEGSSAIVSCAEHKTQHTLCEYQSKCEIQHLMGHLNHRIHEFLSGIALSELLDPPAVLPGSQSSLPQNSPERSAAYAVRN